jgi:transcriptional regulator with XRE-family HTH domain
VTTRRDWIGERKGTPEFEFDLLAISVGEAIVERMDALGLTRTELAERMSVSRARVTQVLTGSDDLTLKTLAAVANALDSAVAVKLEPATTKPAVRGAATA